MKFLIVVLCTLLACARSQNTGSPGTWNHDLALDIVKNVFCDNLASISCGNIVDADICATDGKVYNNKCLFAKVKCFEPDLEVSPPSTCHEHGKTIRSTPLPGGSLMG